MTDERTIPIDEQLYAARPYSTRRRPQGDELGDTLQEEINASLEQRKLVGSDKAIIWNFDRR